jgi:hypothetical protein
VIVASSIVREKVALIGGPPGLAVTGTPRAPSAGFVVAVGVVPISHVAVAGVASTFPALSVAVTVNVWLPSARPV